MSQRVEEQTRNAIEGFNAHADESGTASTSSHGIGLFAGQPPRAVWLRRVKIRVAVIDAVLVYAAVVAAYGLRFGIDDMDVFSPWAQTQGYAYFSVGLIVAWWLMLTFADTRDVRLMGVGWQEYSRVISVTFVVFATLAIVSYLTRFHLARGFVLIALPLGILLLVVGRWLARLVLKRERARGLHMSRAMVIGSWACVDYYVGQLTQLQAVGVQVVAACVPGTSVTSMPVPGPGVKRQATSGSNHIPSIAVMASLAAAQTTALAGGVDVVIAVQSAELTPRALQGMIWQLQHQGIDVVIAPGLADVEAGRIKTAPVPGLPMFIVDKPGYSRGTQKIKRTFDVLGASVLIALLALPLVAVAIAVKVTSPGPVFFTQTRIGLGGKPFTVWKFRSMVVNDEQEWDDARLCGVIDGESTGFLNKPVDDARITTVGKFIRRFSVDELPQLFNVLTGTMSLVGPRPFLAADIERYDKVHGQRRLLIKPGMTGLWQVSGRSNLNAEQSAHLDVYYVDNWSMIADLAIIFRTFKAVIGRDGAY